MFKLFKRNENSKVRELENEIDELRHSLSKVGEEKDAERIKVRATEKLLNQANDMIEELQQTVKSLESKTSKKVTYASARKSLNKTKMKELKAALEKVPAGASFGGSVSVYDKKTKSLKVVELKSKEEALKILKQAENGTLDIVM